MNFIGLLLLVLLFMAAVSAIPAFFISRAVRRRLQSAGNPYARSISVLTFIFSMGLMLTALFFVLFYNFRIER